MKLRYTAPLALSLFAFASFSMAAEGGCAAKAQEIQQQIDYATQHGNSQRVAGLKTALGEVQAHCTDAGLQAERQKRLKTNSTKLQSAVRS
ncbi:hypothetical protein GGER_46510 [Serratia rubidaea]